jgi:FkbM family methyltransferase
MRQIIEEKLLRLVQLYTFNTPIRKGKYRIYQSALALCKARPDSLQVKLKDGRQFYANLTTGMQETVFFIGEFERVLSEIALRLIRPGDVCIDVGANFGWYTSLMARCAKAGEVHSFEPTPQSFFELKRNHELMGSPESVILNNIALGDANGTVQIHLFEGLGSGNASLAGKDNVDSQVFDCEMTTLDSYMDERGMDQVDFVKVDIEGAELMFLKGANRLFAQAVPPIFMIEMASEQTANFGYHPDELIRFLDSHADYNFYAVDEYQGTVRRIKGFTPDEIGANVFCIPCKGPEHSMVVMNEYLVN